MLGIEVIGIIVGGWASNNKWAMLGAMREACQMVSYEIPMGLSLLVPVMCAGTLQLTEIGEMQSGGWFTWLAFRNPFCLAAALTYFIASLASCKRAPFDLPEAESELVAGFHTEYSGFRWAVFFFAEYAAMFVVSAILTLLFLGAWYSPLPVLRSPAELHQMAWYVRPLYDWGAGPLWFIIKCGFLIYTHMWLRWTLPRIRIDQVLYACVQVMLPLTMLLLLGNTAWELFNNGNYPTFQAIARFAHVVTAVVGLVLAGGFPVIVVYSWLNRRRLVGALAVEHLPGS